MQENTARTKMEKSLWLAKECWVNARMPPLHNSGDETAKIALAIIATKIFDQLDDEGDTQATRA